MTRCAINGFIQSQKSLIVESVLVEVIQMGDHAEEALITRTRSSEELPKPVEVVQIY